MSMRVMKYNPAFLTDEEIVRTFTVRDIDLDFILQVLRENTTESNQHILVVGPRGSGKTMLALRVAVEARRDEDLRNRWYPIIFSEESYEVHSPGEFWLQALFHLGEQTSDSVWKDLHVELNEEQDEIRLRDRSIAKLMDFADSQGKRLLLVVENFNMMLAEQMNPDEAWVLRHALLNESRIMLFATATNRFKEIENSNQAMFELFRVITLQPLKEEECRRVWISITGSEPDDDRIRAIQILTGGNLRLLTIISSFGASVSFRDLMRDLMQLVDDHTEYFKSHLDNLPSTERKVYLALAELWNPSIARDIAKMARLDVSKTSSLLNRLVERGAVVVAAQEGRVKYYQIAERMYNIYYLMRRRGMPSRRVRAIVNFIVSFYGREELITTTCRIAEEACQLTSVSRNDHYIAYSEILEQNSDKRFREVLIHMTPHEFFDAEDAPSSLKSYIENESYNRHMSGRQRKGSILNERRVGSTQKAKKFEKKLEDILEQADNFCKTEKLDEAEAAYREALEFEPDSADTWALLGKLLHDNLQRYEEAEAAYRKAIDIDHDHKWASARLGQLLHEKLERYEEAEAAYRKVIELTPNLAWAWAQLGMLLHEKLGRYEEAEAAYRKAIELQPDISLGWMLLGKLLHEKLGRNEEAEAAYRKVIELQPDFSLGWMLLGKLLNEKLGRNEEAEAAYRKVIELEPDCAWAWAQLGQLLHEELGRYEEAEAAFRKAIELKPDYCWAWAQLGSLLHKKLERYEEAEAAYHKAIEVDPYNICGWRGLLDLLLEKRESPQDAERMIQHCAKVNPENPPVLNMLAWKVYKHRLELLYPQAEAWAQEAGRMMPDDAAYQHTIASILTFRQKVPEALKHAGNYLEMTDAVEKTISDAIDLFVMLAAKGAGAEALTILNNSPSAMILEPLIVGLRIFLGEDVKVAAEIKEVGEDVARRIREYTGT